MGMPPMFGFFACTWTSFEGLWVACDAAGGGALLGHDAFAARVGRVVGSGRRAVAHGATAGVRICGGLAHGWIVGSLR